jgi:serine/threonine protein kinase
VQASNGKDITLEEKPFKSGGEGGIFKIVYPSADKDKCVKLYLRKNRDEEKEKKILHMVKKPPPQIMGDGYIVCWPSEVIYQKDEFRGFLMPLAFNNSIETVDLVLPKLRKDLPNEWHTKYDRSQPNGVLARLKICVNIAYALHAIHSKGIYTMVDMKPQNILITHMGKVSIIDIDSMQIAEKHKVIHHARVFTPEYAPPEHKHLTLQRDYIPLSWDRFSAAVMFYQILFGIHPYVATFDDKYKDCDTIEKCIENGLFVHGSNKKYISALPPPHNSFKDIPPMLQKLFVRAFEDGHSDPQKRPPIDEWGRTIYNIAKDNKQTIKVTPPFPVAPKLEISRTSFDFSNLRVGATASGSFSISNIGSGTLSGTIKTDNKKWLKVAKSSFDATQHKDITFYIDTTGLPSGYKNTGDIKIQSNGGTKVVTVNLSVEESTDSVLSRFRWQFMPALTVILASLIYAIGLSFFSLALILFGLGFALSKPLFRYQSTSGKDLILPAWTVAVLLLLAIIIAKSEGPPQESSRVQFTVTAYKDVNARVRTAPSESAEILGVLKIQKGETFGILEAKGDWYKIGVRVNGKDKVGWIYKGLVVPSESKPEVPPEKSTAPYGYDMVPDKGWVPAPAPTIPAEPSQKATPPRQPEPTSFTIEVQSSPSGATVRIDKRTRGTTPLSIVLEKGSHGIAIEKDGYKTKWDIIDVDNHGKKEFYFALERE